MQDKPKSTSVMSSVGQDRLAGLQSVADRLSVSVWTVRKWVQLGKLSSVKLGKRRLIAESEVQRIMMEGLK
jgi:excisionase family DNA binding protein